MADHFHLVAPANQAVKTGRRGTAKDPMWAKRTRLLRGYERLSPEAFTTMWNCLVQGDPSGQILTAWSAKEQLRKLLATTKTSGVRHDHAHRLFRFNSNCSGPAGYGLAPAVGIQG